MHQTVDIIDLAQKAASLCAPVTELHNVLLKDVNVFHLVDGIPSIGMIYFQIILPLLIL
jgi:hypothetical protein